MTTTHAPDSSLGRLPLAACAALVLASLLGAGWVRLSGQNIRAPDAEVTTQRALRFEDRPPEFDTKCRFPPDFRDRPQ